MTADFNVNIEPNSMDVMLPAGKDIPHSTVMLYAALSCAVSLKRIADTLLVIKDKADSIDTNLGWFTQRKY